MHRFTSEQVEFLKKIVYGLSRKDITERFNKEFSLNLAVEQITAYLKNHKIRTGRTGRFEKGHVPANKGMKGIFFGGKETRFKKGNIPNNYLPVGTERVTSTGYSYIKVADPNQWKSKHLIEWERLHGMVPDGHKVIFADGNKMNFTANNLMLVRNNTLLIMNRNKLIKNDAELTRTGIIIADLIIQIAKVKGRKNT
jgi:hypothetical protein